MALRHAARGPFDQEAELLQGLCALSVLAPGWLPQQAPAHVGDTKSY